MRSILLLALLALCAAPLVRKLEGYGADSWRRAGTGGGASLYISGVGLGSAEAPPSVLVGSSPCEVQSFTSTSERLHCLLPVVSHADFAMAELDERCVRLPLRVVVSGTIANCLVDCVVLIDFTKTPNVTDIRTPLLEPGGACLGLCARISSFCFAAFMLFCSSS